MSITVEADKVFFWSDLHLFHRAAQRARGHIDIETMNEAIIRQAEHLKPTDTLIFIGDVSFGKYDETMALLDRIKARRILVMGNHDSGLAKHIDKMYDEVHQLLRVKIVEYVGPEGHKRKEKLAEIICCHYPLLVWDKMHHGSWHLHGHCHGSLVHPGRLGKMMDVGYDVWNRPVDYYNVKGYMGVRPIVSYDHHKPDSEKGDWTL